jgi:hypothetical protein
MRAAIIIKQLIIRDRFIHPIIIVCIFLKFKLSV